MRTQDWTRRLCIPSDPADLRNPVLAVASDILRERWHQSALPLVELAEAINDHFDGLAGFDKDNL